MAAPLRIGFGSRKIWTEHIKNYQCTNIHAFVQICTFPHENPPNSLDYRCDPQTRPSMSFVDNTIDLVKVQSRYNVSEGSRPTFILETLIFIAQKKASVPETSLIRPVVSTQHRRVTDGRMDTQGH